jgi:predicted nucleic acid-binding protein
MLVLDASVAIRSCAGEGFGLYREEPLCAPPVMWSEFRAGLRAALWHRHITRESAERTFAQLDMAPIEERSHPELGHRAWALADRLGWASTYDAEYLALGELLACRVVTRDGRLRRGADRLGFVITPEELAR